MFRFIYHWFLEKLFNKYVNNGKELLSMIRLDLLGDIGTSTFLSIEKNPNQWQDLIRKINSRGLASRHSNMPELLLLMGAEKYLTTPKHYQIIGSNKQSHLDTLMNNEDGGDPNDFH